MKTKVRIIRGHADRTGYSHLYLQFLISKKHYKSLEIAFTIRFQTGGKYDDGRDMGWYGYNVITETDKPEFIQYAYKIAKLIGTKLDYFTCTPAEVLKLVNAELYSYTDGYFIPCSKSGCSLFKLYKEGEYYAPIFAMNEKEAWKIANKEYEVKERPNTDWFLREVRKNINLASDSIEL